MPRELSQHCPRAFSALLFCDTVDGTGRAQSGAAPQPDLESVDDMLAAAIKGKALTAYVARPADLLFVRPVDDAV